MDKSKNINGEGSVYFLESQNRWVAKIQYGKDNKGKLLIKQFSSQDKKKGKQIVSKKLQEFKKQLILGNTKTCNIKLNDYIVSWLETYQKPKVKATILHRDYTVFNGHIKYTISGRKISDIKQLDIQRLINSEKDIYANKTIEKTYSLLNRVFSTAVMLGDINKNPCVGVVLPSIHSNKVAPKEICEYTEEETNRMKEGIYNSFYNQ